MTKLNNDQLAIVSDLAAAANIITSARDRAPAGSDLREMIDDIHMHIDTIAQRLCGYKFDAAGKHVDTSEVRMA